MKKLIYAAMLLFGLSMMASCGGNKQENNETKNTETSVQQESSTKEEKTEPVDSRPRVYANAFDGFVNIREKPEAKASIVGTFKNGPEGAVLLDSDGEWTKIDCNGIVGYVLSKFIQDTPTEAIDEGITMDWLEGWWKYNEFESILIFDNGGFMEYNCGFNEGSYTSKGSFKLQGSSLVLNIDVDFVRWPEEPDPKTKTLTLDPNKKTIVGYKKEPLKTKELREYLIEEYGDEYMSYDGFYLTKKEFNELKKHVFDKYTGY